MSAATRVTGRTAIIDTERLAHFLDRAFIFGVIMLIPYDIPLIHQAAVPLAALAMLLMALRRDAPQFLVFLRSLPVPLALMAILCFVAMFSLYGNVGPILDSAFQQENGWTRGAAQAALLLATAVFPFYFAFSLCRHADWPSMVVRAAWWSLPIPLLVGSLQLANFFGVPGLSHLPYVGGSYEGGFWRLTSVARESSWFGSYACVILVFLIPSAMRCAGWQKAAGIAAIATVLIFVVFGTSKSAYAALAIEAAVAAVILVAVQRRWRVVAKVLFGLVVMITFFLVLSVVAPTIFARFSAPVVKKALLLYQLFEPLLTQNTRFVSIGTRFGMSAAGIAMGEAHPLIGVGLGQFGFHAYNFTPSWGLNGETLTWLSDDAKSWPSTSNLYSRLLAEIGPLGCAVYIAFRLALLLAVGARLLRRDSPTWQRDLGIFAIMTSLVAFDFHRDSFVDMDSWAALGLALACWQEKAVPVAVASFEENSRSPRIFFAVVGVSFVIALGIILARPVSYQASTTIAPYSTGVKIAPLATIQDVGPTVSLGGNPLSRFRLLRTYWASTTVAARIIAAQPDLARAILEGASPTPMALADYIHDNVTVLMADKQTTLTLQYRNRDPVIADHFLRLAIQETDRAMAADATARGRQATQLLRLTLDADLDNSTRQTILSQIAAQELQSGFDAAGDPVNFEYVEYPTVSQVSISPRPVTAILFAFVLAFLSGLLATGAWLVRPATWQLATR